MPAKLKTVWWQRSHEDLALLSDEELAGCKELETAELVELSDVQMEAYAAASLHVQRVMLSAHGCMSSSSGSGTSRSRRRRSRSCSRSPRSTAKRTSSASIPGRAAGSRSRRTT